MCGIAGIIDFRGRPIDESQLARFCDALAHRGPDDRGTFLHHAEGLSVGLAHTRLAIIDPTPDGRQPMTASRGRYALTYNGELYNYRELAARIPAELHTRCDTEVVLNACVHDRSAERRFDGMWALAFVDTAERRGHLSRDPFGIKPLYYTIYDGRLIFASELRALDAVPGWPRRIDTAALAAYLKLGFVPHPRTIYENVHKLPPGCRLTFDASGPQSPEEYFALKPPSGEPIPYEAAREQLRSLIGSAVQRQLVSDVPLGAFLSGGLDSAVIVACMAKHGRRAKTFSIGYEGHDRYDETHYATLLAKHFDTDHHVFQLTFDDVLAAVEPMVDHLGEPFADSSLLPTSIVSRLTREHVTVALSGDGGDELFGGYWRYLGHHYLDRYERIPSLVRSGLIEPLLNRLPDARSTRLLDKLRQFRKLLRGQGDSPLDRHIAWARIIDEDLFDAIMAGREGSDAIPPLRSYYESAVARLSGDDHSAIDPLNRILLADLGMTLPDDMLAKVDTASMAHNLEVRVPLLSNDVATFTVALPADYKLHGGVSKRILRDAFRSDLPPTILNRAKMGFEVPIGEFLRNGLRDLYRDTVTPEVLSDLGLNEKTADQICDEHIARRRDHSALLWSLFVLCRWYSARPRPSEADPRIGA